MFLRDKEGRFTKKNITIKLIIGIWLLAGIFAITLYTLERINKWSQENVIVGQDIVTLKLAFPYRIEKAQPITILSPIAKDIVEGTTSDNLSDIEKIILNVFGERNFQVARSIAKAESGLSETAFHANTNGTIDVGVFQINSVHFNKEGCSLKEIVNAEANIKCAYKIFIDQGWEPWVVYTSGAFKRSL